ncbi:MAG TPA: hypothetical protein VIG06_19740 [Kofleriaceae bacterium]|jgi:hypothetical protein
MRVVSTAVIAAALAGGPACSGDPTSGGADAGPGAAADAAANGDGDLPDAGPSFVPEPLMIGIASGHPGFLHHPDLETFFESSTGERHFRMGHMYVPWNVALEPSDRRDELEEWLAAAAEHQLEPLIVFGPERTVPDGPFDSYRPTVDEFAAAFDAFRATWPAVDRFISWNEPNAPVTEVAPELAADYHMRIAERCGEECEVAAGNFRGMTSSDNDDLRMGPGGPDHPDCSAGGSYLDRYKCRLAAGGVHPAVWAFHPYLDGDRYRRLSFHCSDPQVCQTRVLMAQLSGSWSASEIWMTEAGALYASPSLAASEHEQACTGAFYLRLFERPEWEGRVTRFYYFNWFGYTDDMGIVDKTEAHAPRAVFHQLRDRVTMYDAACP